jgi:hypothetical protein
MDAGAGSRSPCPDPPVAAAASRRPLFMDRSDMLGLAFTGKDRARPK